MTSDFKFFLIVLLRFSKFWCIVSLTAFLRLLQRITLLFFNLQFLLLLSGRGLNPESCLAIYHSTGLVAFKPIAGK